MLKSYSFLKVIIVSVPEKFQVEMTVWQIVDFLFEDSTGRKPEFYHCQNYWTYTYENFYTY